MTSKLILAALLAVMTAQAGAAQDPKPYRVSVWSRVLFGADGKPAEYAIVDEDKYPAQFVENVRSRLANASIQPPVVDGHAATLRSGVEMRFTVRPAAEGSGTVRVDGLSVRALPLKTYYASYPKDIKKTGGWEGEVTGVCMIGIDGRCGSIEVVALPGMPESVRRYAKASLEGWQFEPQEIDGKPVESEFRLNLRLHTLDNVPEDFRQDKFQRLLKNK
jgi:hypothetical protein